MKTKTREPSKEEIKAAREKRRQGRALMREAEKVLHKIRFRKRRSRRRVPISDEQSAFYTWEHDLEVLARAVVRAPGANIWNADEIARRCSEAADRMKQEVSDRAPASYRRVRGLYRSRFALSHQQWMRWQETFDSFVHELADKTLLSADDVIARAIALADAMLKVSKERKAAMLPQKRRAAA